MLRCFQFRRIHTVRYESSGSAICITEIILNTFAQDNYFICIFYRISFTLPDESGSKTRLPFLTLPVDPVNGNYDSFAKQLGQPCEKGRSLSMDMNHIIFSQCTKESCEEGRTYGCKPFLFDRRNIFLADSLIFPLIRIVIFCPTDVMP